MHGSLVILPMGFEEIEAITPIDLLRRANLNVTIAALDYPMQVTGRSRLDIITDGALSEFAANEYDAVILIGGPGHTQYRGHTALFDFLKKHKGITAAICAAPIALHEAGLLAGKRYTCHPAHRNELTAALNEDVVVDGRLVTASGAGTAFAFGLKLVELLVGAEEAAKIAQATCFTK